MPGHHAFQAVPNIWEWATSHSGCKILRDVSTLEGKLGIDGPTVVFPHHWLQCFQFPLTLRISQVWAFVIGITTWRAKYCFISKGQKLRLQFWSTKWYMPYIYSLRKTKTEDRRRRETPAQRERTGEKEQARPSFLIKDFSLQEPQTSSSPLIQNTNRVDSLAPL